MAPKQKSRTAPDRSRADAQNEDLSTNVAPDMIENIPEGSETDIPVTGGSMPAEDGGNPQHPIHDEDQEDLTPDDFEREIDNATSAR